MKVWLRLAFRELKNRSAFSLLFILNMSLGLTGFIAVNSFKSSILEYLEQNLRNILTADAVVRSRQPFTEAERRFLEDFFGDDFEKSETREFFSMVASGQNSRLMQVVAIDENYPLYGEIVLENQGRVNSELISQTLTGKRNVWMKSDGMIMLGAEPGGNIKLGRSSFVVQDLVKKEPGVELGASGIASRLFVSEDALETTGLLERGTRTNHLIYLKSKTGEDLAGIKERFFNRLFAELGDEAKLRFNTYEDASERIGGLLSRIVGYLNLIAIIALFMAGVGSAYLFRGYFQSRLKQVGILMSLGADKKKSYLLIFLQVGILGFASSALTLLFGSLLLPLMPLVLDKIIPVKLEFSIGFSTAMFTFLLGTLNSLVFCFPVIVKYRRAKPLHILRGVSPAEGGSRFDPLIPLSYLPVVLAFGGMSVWQTSFREGVFFLGVFMAALLLIGMVCLLLIKIGERFSNRAPLFLKIAMRNVSRHKLSTVSCFTAIALGTFLVSIIPQIYQGIYQEIRKPAGIDVPALFMFDIQEEQVEGLRELVGDENAALRNVSPLIRARLVSVNGRDVNDFLQTMRDEDVDEGPFSGTRRVFNLSYRERMLESEVLVDGKTFEESAPGMEEGTSMISLVQRFAERYGFEIGDVLEFNIQGLRVKGEVVNLRRVKWNSFQPNFFIVMNEADLLDAPKIFLANVSESDGIDKIDLQNKIVGRFPNISVVNVTEALLQIIGIAEKMIFAITAMAYLSIIAGLTVIFSIAGTESQNRSWEINMMKVLGSRFADLRRVVMYEFALTGIISAVVGMGLSIAFSIAVSQFLFSGIWAGSLAMNSLTLGLITLVIVATTQAATAKVVMQKPWQFLRK